MEHEDTLVSRSKTCGDWKIVRSLLTQPGAVGSWMETFDDYFYSRIETRYLEPIKSLQQLKRNEGEGFSIVAIHCTLIEFLESTLQGTRYRYVRNDKDLKPNEYNKSAPVFINFLATRSPFNKCFDQTLAKDFYEKVRCSLLHEARTREWKILANSSIGSMIDPINKIIYRNDFHQALLVFISSYRKSLAVDRSLQEAFVRKFDSICD
jgi:hypothetical protein